MVAILPFQQKGRNIHLYENEKHPSFFKGEMYLAKRRKNNSKE